jgi:hypothetical protein
MKRMMHPKHGFHVVSYGDDVEAMRRAGWVDDDGKARASKLSAAVPLPQVTGNTADAAVAPPVKRGPGRPRKA